MLKVKFLKNGLETEMAPKVAKILEARGELEILGEGKPEVAAFVKKRGRPSSTDSARITPEV